MKRSEEVLRVAQLRAQVIGIHGVASEDQLEKHLRDLQALHSELREIISGAKPDEDVAL